MKQRTELKGGLEKRRLKALAEALKAAEGDDLKYLTMADMTRLTGYTGVSIYKWVRGGKLPKKVAFRRKVVREVSFVGWRREDLAKWLDQK